MGVAFTFAGVSLSRALGVDVARFPAERFENEGRVALRAAVVALVTVQRDGARLAFVADDVEPALGAFAARTGPVFAATGAAQLGEERSQRVVAIIAAGK
jgi:hypothetical protein